MHLLVPSERNGAVARMKPRWWTCGCGNKNVTRDLGKPVCDGCGKAAGFAVEPPRGQAGFDFGPEPAGKTGYEE